MTKAADAFEVVYGRPPADNELPVIAWLDAQSAPLQHQAGDTAVRPLAGKTPPSVMSAAGFTSLFAKGVKTLSQRALHIVNGRRPGPDEVESDSSPDAQSRSTAQLFHSLLGQYDHQTLSTPFSVSFGEGDVEYVDLGGCELAIDRADAAVSMPILQGLYEKHLVNFYRDRLKPGMTFIDVGANIGLYSVVAASLVGAEGRVLSFEPSSENCRLLLLSIERNSFRNIELFPLALSDRAGYSLFTRAIGSNGTLLPAKALMEPCTVVPTMRLDDLVKDRVDFMKMDVEGAEGLVVHGAQALIERWRPVVTTEFSVAMLNRTSLIDAEDYLALFQKLGYNIHLVERGTGELRPITDIPSFLSDYEPTRIEDLVLLPE